MKHIHLFQHTGGGCSNNGTSYLCDDSYECECGAKFRTMSDMETHFVMPSYIAGKDEPEVAKVETHLREDLNLIKNKIYFPRAKGSALTDFGTGLLMIVCGAIVVTLLIMFFPI